jgi:hypothetical protein
MRCRCHQPSLNRGRWHVTDLAPPSPQAVDTRVDTSHARAAASGDRWPTWGLGQTSPSLDCSTRQQVHAAGLSIAAVLPHHKVHQSAKRAKSPGKTANSQRPVKSWTSAWTPRRSPKPWTVAECRANCHGERRSAYTKSGQRLRHTAYAGVKS